MTASAKQSGLAPAKSSLPGLRAELIINRRKTGISIERDAVHSAMWRVRRSGEPPSDMVNLSRATDAAIAWARPRGLGGTETANWHWGHSGKRACHAAHALFPAEVPRQPPAPGALYGTPPT